MVQKCFESFPSSSVLEGSIPKCLIFPLENISTFCGFLLFFLLLLFFKDGKGEERWKGEDRNKTQNGLGNESKNGL